MTQADTMDRDAAPVTVSPLIDAQVFGDLLGVSVKSIWRYNDAGRAPVPLAIGGLKKWKRAEIMDWIDAGCPKRKEWEAIKSARK